MVTTTCVVTFEFENLNSITLKDPEASVYKVIAKCTQCGETHRNELHVDPSAEHPLPTKGDRGSANCVWKCSLCERKSYINVMTKKFLPFDSEEGTDLSISFESRGCEVLEWILDPSDLKATGVGGQEFESIDGKDWCDFDEEANEQVGIYDWECTAK